MAGLCSPTARVRHREEDPVPFFSPATGLCAFPAPQPCCASSPPHSSPVPYKSRLRGQPQPRCIPALSRQVAPAASQWPGPGFCVLLCLAGDPGCQGSSPRRCSPMGKAVLHIPKLLAPQSGWREWRVPLGCCGRACPCPQQDGMGLVA